MYPRSLKMAAGRERNLIDAIKTQSLIKAEKLLKYGADPNRVTNKDEVSAMHLASGLGMKVVSLLLQYGGDPNISSADGTTPVHIASMWGDSDSLQLLLANGGDPFIRDQDGLNALELSRKYEHRDVSEILETYILLLRPDTDHTITPKYTYRRVSTESLVSYLSDGSDLTENTLDCSAFDTQQLDDYLSRITKHRRSSVYLNHLQRQLDRYFSDGKKTHTYDVTSPDHPYIEPKNSMSVGAEDCTNASIQTTSSDSFVTCDGEDLETMLQRDLPDLCQMPNRKREEKNYLHIQPERHIQESKTRQSDILTERHVTGCGLMSKKFGSLGNVPPSKDCDIDQLTRRLKRSSLYDREHQKNPQHNGFTSDGPGIEADTNNFSDDTLISSDESFFWRNPDRLNTGFQDGDISTISVADNRTNNATGVCDISGYETEARDTFTDNTDLWACVRERKFQNRRALDTGFCGRASNCSQISSASTVDYVYTDPEKGITLIERHIPSQCGSVGRRSIESSSSSPSNDSVESETTVLYDLKNYVPCERDNNEKDQKKGAPSTCISPELQSLDNARIRSKLCNLGDDPGPVIESTRQTYLTRLSRLENEPDLQLTLTRQKPGYPLELTKALKGEFDLSGMAEMEMKMVKQFQNPDRNKRWREGTLKSSFNYLLLDPRISKNLPNRACNMGDLEVFKVFITAIFYIGKGKRARPYSHLYEAIRQLRSPANKVSSKVEHILDIWADDLGVVSLHCYQSVIPVEAYTREACMVEAIGLEKLTNQKRGDYYGISTTYSMKEKRQMGVYLLKKALQIFLAEGERQISPVDIRN